MSEPLSPLWELTKAQWRDFFREPGSIFWVFGFPILVMAGVGLAYRDRPPERMRVGLVAGAEGSALGAALESAGARLRVMDAREAAEALRSDEIDLVVSSGGARAVSYRFDPARPRSREARLWANEVLQRSPGSEPALAVEDIPVTRGARYIDFLLPGLIGINLMGGSLWGIGFSVVLMRKRRLLRRFAVTPMRRSHFLLSFIFARLLLLLLEVAAIMLCGELLFGVHLQGSVAQLLLLSAAGSMCFAGLAFVVAARVQSIEAANGWLNLIMMPSWLLSGVFFSYTRFPEIMQPAIRALPMTALNDALRLVINKGGSLASLWSELATLAAWGIACFAISLRTFRWQ